MNRLRVVGLCLVAMVALCAVATASAWAEAPEYGRCEKAEKVGKEYKGRFSSSGCTKEVSEAERAKKGKYEWHPGALKKFQTSSGGKGQLEETDGLGVGCATEHSSGEYSGTKEVKNVIVIFTKCESVKLACNSPGHASGELETAPLEGTVVWENKAAHKAALDLYPAHGAEKFIEFDCGPVITIAVRGSILVPVKTDKMASTFSLKYKQKRGIQADTEYETATGKKIKDVLESNFSEKGWLQAGQAITSTITNEEKLELNAYV